MARREQLAEIVRRIVDQELAALVDQELEHALANGNGATTPAPEPDAPATRICVACRREKPVTAYEQARTKCRACRRREHLERVQAREAAAQADTTEPPRSHE